MSKRKIKQAHEYGALLSVSVMNKARSYKGLVVQSHIPHELGDEYGSALSTMRSFDILGRTKRFRNSDCVYGYYRGVAFHYNPYFDDGSIDHAELRVIEHIKTEVYVYLCEQEIGV